MTAIKDIVVRHFKAPVDGVIITIRNDAGDSRRWSVRIEGAETLEDAARRCARRAQAWLDDPHYKHPLTGARIDA